MENKNEIINNDSQPIIKVKKPVSEAQKEAQSQSNITESDTINMPLCQLIHLDYNFTKEEKTYLSNDNTCVIDNLVGVYGKELKLNKEKLIALDKKIRGCRRR